MHFKLYSFLFIAFELALLATKGMAYYDDNFELASRELGLDGFAHHYLRDLYDNELSHIATRDLVFELESRLVRRDWSSLPLDKLETKLNEYRTKLQSAKDKKRAAIQKQIDSLEALIAKAKNKVGGHGGGAGGAHHDTAGTSAGETSGNAAPGGST
ncbi:hypothetical protein BJ165DRAFT_1595677 [Panaeolus papilionaceus]|nr:hypothetical protein BJ165DRAFT_1595677 [Panaeolus papilionaceus]